MKDVFIKWYAAKRKKLFLYKECTNLLNLTLLRAFTELKKGGKPPNIKKSADLKQTSQLVKLAVIWLDVEASHYTLFDGGVACRI